MSDIAEIDLDEIYTYIAEVLMVPITAWHQIEHIRDAVQSLDEMPERGTLLQDEPWRSRGLRQVFIDNYVIIYDIHKQSFTVTVIAIIYSRRNIGDFLSFEGR